MSFLPLHPSWILREVCLLVFCWVCEGWEMWGAGAWVVGASGLVRCFFIEVSGAELPLEPGLADPNPRLTEPKPRLGYPRPKLRDPKARLGDPNPT